MLATTGAAFAGVAFGPARRALAAPAAEILETKVITHKPNLYHGWPTVGLRKNGQLLVVCSGGREGHICPFGRVEMMRSDDDGQTWGWPCVLMDSEIDDRDAGVMETDKGTILVTSFTSLAYADPELHKWPKDEERLRRWQAAHNRLGAEERQKLLSGWMIRSTDGGLTWSERYKTPLYSPHGPIQLSDGRQLYVGQNFFYNFQNYCGDEPRIGVCESTDDGQTWRWLAGIPTRSGDAQHKYCELHAVEAADSSIIAQIRNLNKQNPRETLQTESTDGGKTWTEPHSIGVFGYPSHLLRLHDDRLLMTFGHRRKPYGSQARVSDDRGRTWSEPTIVIGDAMGADMGYPSTVQLPDGTLLTVAYEVMRGSPRAVLRQVKWQLKG
jgi:hypothetical protein